MQVDVDARRKKMIVSGNVQALEFHSRDLRFP